MSECLSNTHSVSVNLLSLLESLEAALAGGKRGRDDPRSVAVSTESEVAVE